MKGLSKVTISLVRGLDRRCFVSFWNVCLVLLIITFWIAYRLWARLQSLELAILAIAQSLTLLAVLVGVFKNVYEFLEKLRPAPRPCEEDAAALGKRDLERLLITVVFLFVSALGLAIGSYGPFLVVYRQQDARESRRLLLGWLEKLDLRRRTTPEPQERLLSLMARHTDRQFRTLDAFCWLLPEEKDVLELSCQFLTEYHRLCEDPKRRPSPVCELMERDYIARYNEPSTQRGSRCDPKKCDGVSLPGPRVSPPATPPEGAPPEWWRGGDGHISPQGL